jgi:long-subunit acyl-CoA synthetase (AMP-forming)
MLSHENILATVEIKLLDIPGTKYRSERNQGEVCIRGPTVFKGK